jgi:hypothetical protein
MANIFESEEVWYIALPGLGRVFMAEHNHQAGRIVVCQGCRGEILPNAGYRFKKEKYSTGFFNGFMCRECIVKGLQAVERWHFDAMNGVLLKANGYTFTPIGGHQLAEYFTLMGAPGLMAVIRAALERQTKLIS